MDEQRVVRKLETVAAILAGMETARTDALRELENVRRGLGGAPFALPTGPLTMDEFQTLANLIRRFEVNHIDGSARSAVEHADEIIRSVYSNLYVPA
jgi:hypothetical protein